MRVAIDNGPLSGGHSVRGVGVSTEGLINSLLKYNDDNKIIIEPVDFSTQNLKGYDIVHYTSFNPYFFNLPKIGSTKNKTVLTIHDLIPLIYKNEYSPGIKGTLRFQLNKILVGRTDSIITVSNTSKKDIVRLLGIEGEKIDVVYWAHNPLFRRISNKNFLQNVKSKYELPDVFVLYVGDINYNKNLSTLIEACGSIHIPLVIVGKQAENIDPIHKRKKTIQGPKDLMRSLLGVPHPETEHFENLSRSMKINRVITPGFVATEDLIGIYNLASVYCQPSYYEGFGIPVLEAFACETPVVISRTQALVEIANGAALTANPYSAKDFADKISVLLKESTERLHLVRAGITRSKYFSWEETARKTIDIYKKVAAGEK